MSIIKKDLIKNSFHAFLYNNEAKIKKKALYSLPSNNNSNFRKHSKKDKGNLHTFH